MAGDNAMAGSASGIFYWRDMRDFDVIVHQFYGGHDITIVPLADTHLGSEGCMEQDFIKFTKQILDTPNQYVILAGDLLDNAVKSSIGNVYHATIPPMEQKIMMCKILEPLAKEGRILCIVPGNHERRSGKETDSDPTYDIAAKLNLEHLYRESIAFLKIQMGREDSDGKRPAAYQRPTYALAVIHGAAGGLTGNAVNRGEKFALAMDGIDCLIMAHSHRPWTTQSAKLKFDTNNNVVSVTDFKVISASSWLNYVGYPIQKMLPPSGHCEQVLKLSGKNKQMKVEM